MNTNFLKDVELSSECDLTFDSDSSQENVEIPDTYLKVFKQIKNKEMSFDDKKNVYFYEFSEIDKYLEKRYEARIRYFNKFKRKHNLKFTSDADEKFKNFLQFMYFEKNIDYYYFIKKICDLHNIPHNLVDKGNEKIWNRFIKMLCNKWK